MSVKMPRLKHFSGLRVLIVEDNPVSQRLAYLQLQSLGCLASVASSGQQALEALATFEYPVVLLDCEMPEMDGYTVAAEMRRREGSGRKVVIIAMTAHAAEATRQRSLAAGMDDYIAKPVMLRTLTAVLALWTQRRPDSRTVMRVASANEAEKQVEELDLSTIDELERLSIATGYDVVRDVVQTFLNSLPEHLVALESAKDQRDLGAISQIAHLLKGESSSVGALRFAAKCEVLKECADSLNVEGMVKAANDLMAGAESLSDLLQNAVAASKSACRVVPNTARIANNFKKGVV